MTKSAKSSKKKTKMGRPIGSTKFEKDDFIEIAIDAYKHALKYYKHPTQKEVASELRISRATFCRYLNKYISWNDIKGSAQWEALRKR